MGLFDAIDVRSTYGARLDDPEPFPGFQSVLNRPETVGANHTMHLTPRQLLPCAKQGSQHSAPGAWDDAPKGFAEVHMTKLSVT